VPAETVITISTAEADIKKIGFGRVACLFFSLETETPACNIAKE
jgi:hypothetical protein